MLIPTCIIKFFELTLAVACLVLHHYSYDLTDVSTLILCSGTYVGYIVVLSGEIVGEIIYAPLDLIQDMYFAILGTILFATSGGLICCSRLWINHPRTGDHTAALIVGILSIVTALVMLFDLIIAYMDSEEFEEESEAISASADAYVDGWWSASGSLLFGACGGFTLSSWRDVPACERRGLAQATAVCALAAAALLGVDALLAICSANRDNSVQKKDVK